MILYYICIVFSNMVCLDLIAETCRASYLGRIMSIEKNILVNVNYE